MMGCRPTVQRSAASLTLSHTHSDTALSVTATDHSATVRSIDLEFRSMAQPDASSGAPGQVIRPRSLL